MSKRELIRRLIAGEAVERCGFWLGNPDPATWPILHRHFGTTTEEELRCKLNDDVRWICPQFYPDEAILPNVPPENVEALAREALESNP